ncbi:hypothetical protein V1517DRAFT_375106 [Lipomyces orientalis]|uniref:Uncharacterized protein n=1 Tax=Lipomyces orientalis TaxID=1233043 RepID=A0ACC3TIP9_9ASCO
MTLAGRKILPARSRRGITARVPIAQIAPKQQVTSTASNSSDEGDISDTAPAAGLTFAAPPTAGQLAVSPNLFRIANKRKTGQENEPPFKRPDNNTHTQNKINIQLQTVPQEHQKPPQRTILHPKSRRGLTSRAAISAQNAPNQRTTANTSTSSDEDDISNATPNVSLLSLPQKIARPGVPIPIDPAQETGQRFPEIAVLPLATISNKCQTGQENMPTNTASTTEQGTDSTSNNTAFQHTSVAGILASLRASNANKLHGVVQEQVKPAVRQSQKETNTEQHSEPQEQQKPSHRKILQPKSRRATALSFDSADETSPKSGTSAAGIFASLSAGNTNISDETSVAPSGGHPQPQEEQKRPHRKIKKPVSRLAQSQTAIPQTPAGSKRTIKTKSPPYAVSAAVSAKHDASPSLYNNTRPLKPATGRPEDTGPIKDGGTQMMAIPSAPADPFKSQEYLQGFQALEQLFRTRQQKREYEEFQHGIAASSQSCPRAMHLLSNAAVVSSLRPLRTSPDKQLQEYLAKPPERKPPPAPSWAKPRARSIGVINQRRSARIAAIQSHHHQASLVDTVMKDSVPLHQSPRSLKPITARSRTTKPRSPPRSKTPQFSPSDLPPVRSMADVMNENPDILEALRISDRHPLDGQWERIETPQRPRRRRNPEPRPQNRELVDIQATCMVLGCLFATAIVFWILQKGVSAGFRWCHIHLRGT